jgi:hypothetical protein
MTTVEIVAAAVCGILLVAIARKLPVRLIISKKEIKLSIGGDPDAARS